jgi:hypothetical protein
MLDVCTRIGGAMPAKPIPGMHMLNSIAPKDILAIFFISPPIIT